MLRNFVEEVVDWVYNTTDNYSVTTALSLDLMAQGEHTFNSYPAIDAYMRQHYFVKYCNKVERQFDNLT